MPAALLFQIDKKPDTGAIIHSRFEEVGEGWCVLMWISSTGKKKKNLPRCPTFPCTHTHTHVCMMTEKHSPALHKCLAMPLS